MKLSTTLTQNILTNLCGRSGAHTVTIGAENNCWAALYVGDPENGGTELSARGYERVNISSLMSMTYQSYSLGETANVAHSRRIGNASQISFPEAVKSDILVDAEHGGRWALADHWALFTAKTGGSPMAWGELDEPIATDTHQVFIVRKGHLEIYMEPDTEYVYYGAYVDEAAFIAAIRANEEVTDVADLTMGRASVTERKLSTTANVTGKYFFFAYPADFSGKPSFRAAGTTDAYGDVSYAEYTADRSSDALIAKSYYRTTEVDGNTVVLADRDNAYYVYKITGIKGSGTALTGEITVNVY